MMLYLGALYLKRYGQALRRPAEDVQGSQLCDFVRVNSG